MLINSQGLLNCCCKASYSEKSQWLRRKLKYTDMYAFVCVYKGYRLLLFHYAGPSRYSNSGAFLGIKGKDSDLC